jgi:hypothetical protein
MAKRFTDTTKWNKPFIRGMKAPYKLLWIYILDECDHAGIWQVDFEVAEIKIGEKLNKETAINFFKDKIIAFDDKWFIIDFIEFQYGVLNPLNRAHNSVISILSKYNLLDESYKIKPLISPLQGAKDMDKDKDKDKDMDKDNESKIKILKTDLEIAFDCFLEMRKKIKKPATDRAIEMAKKKVMELANGNEQLAIEILNQSTLNCWSDLYALKHTQTQTTPTRRTTNEVFDNVKAQIMNGELEIKPIL